MKEKHFFNLYNQGFIRVALCIPEVRVADIDFNTGEMIKMARQAAASDAIYALFPELVHQDEQLQVRGRFLEHVVEKSCLSAPQET